MVKLDMQFLADVFVECESCQGNRYNRETLEVRFRGRNIAEILDMSVSESKDLFAKHPAILAKLETLDAVGSVTSSLGNRPIPYPEENLRGSSSLLNLVSVKRVGLFISLMNPRPVFTGSMSSD